MNQDEVGKRKHGDITAAVIGALVALGDNPRGYTAGELAARLGYAESDRVARMRVTTRLHELAKQGRIERVSRGRYAGV